MFDVVLHQSLLIASIVCCFDVVLSCLSLSLSGCMDVWMSVCNVSTYVRVQEHHQIYCHRCRDFVYDAEFDVMCLQERNDALSARRRLQSKWR